MSEQPVKPTATRRSSKARSGYADYLGLPSLFAAARPLTDVPDEHLFITTHQALELWFAQSLREINQVKLAMAADQLALASRGMERLVEMVDLWIRHLDVLDTLPAAAFASFRSALGTASGAQSEKFRLVELTSGVDPAQVRRGTAGISGVPRPAADGPSLRVAHLELLARRQQTPATVFSDADKWPESTYLAELLLSYDISLNRWRHRHWQLVMHVIGAAPGSGGSSGLPYLRRTLDHWCFAELWSGRETAFGQATSWPPHAAALDGATHLDRATIGGKGYGLQQMSALGLPVPPAFVLTVAVCRDYRRKGRLTHSTWGLVLEHLAALERSTGRRFGGTPPLLLSVRSGAAVSMPGMMDTELNVGCTPAALRWFESHDCAPVMIEELRRRLARSAASDDTHAAKSSPTSEPADAARQELRDAICRVLQSWDSDRARTYRRANGIDDDLGTAVVIQAMVFGNLDSRSGTGVYFTRNPIDGSPEPFGEWLAHAQGEDLVAGERTPVSLEQLIVDYPQVYQDLISIGRRLERTRSNVLEIEFTIESGALYLLQVREATGTPDATVHWVVDLVHDGVIDVEDALGRVSPKWLPAASRTTADREGPVLARGIGVSEGIASGEVTDDVEQAISLAEQGRPVVLARPTTSPHDIHGFLASSAIITDRGGSTSHAAVVGRQMGLPCVVGCGDGVSAELVGKMVTVDAGRGVVYEGDLRSQTVAASHSPQIACFLRWQARDRSARVPTMQPSQVTVDLPHQGRDADVD